jgi:hypothetical protein
MAFGATVHPPRWEALHSGAFMEDGERDLLRDGNG